MVSRWRRCPTSLVPILILVGVSPALAAPAPNVRFERITIERGLSQSSVICILRDGEGFMWFGTEDGLNKYDGYRFTVYRHDPDVSGSLSNSYITSLHQDRAGTLWIGTRGGGLNQLDRVTERFRHYIHEPEDPHSLSNNAVSSIYEDISGSLWVGTEGGLNKLEPARESKARRRVLRYLHDPNDEQSLSSNAVTSIHEDYEGSLWIGTGSGLNRLHREKNKITRYVHDPRAPESIASNDVRAVYESSSGTLWVGTYGGGLNRFDREQGRFVHYLHDPANPVSIASNDINSIYEDPASPGTLWIGTRLGGLNRFFVEQERFVRYRNDPKNVESLSNNRVTTTYRDPSGTLWIGTYDGGVNRLHRNHDRIFNYVADPEDPASLSDDNVRSIYEDRQGVLWVGTYDGGLNRLDRLTGAFTRYLHDPHNPRSLSANDVRSIVEDDSGTLWVGTYHGGLNRFDRDRDLFFQYRNRPDDPHSLSDDRVDVVYLDSQGDLWVGTDVGLNRFDRSRERFTRYLNDPHDTNTLGHNAVLYVYEDRAGTLWFGTFGGGLSRWDRDQDRFTRYVHAPEDPGSLSVNFVTSIYEDRSGSFWIGTFGGGLDRMDRDREHFTHFTEKDGLPNAVIYGILEDDRGRLWLSTHGGLSRFDPHRESFRNYDVSDGLLGNEFGTKAFYRGREGKMYFGGLHGISVFHPEELEDNPTVPPIVLTDFQVFNESTRTARNYSSLWRTLSESGRVGLSYRESVFSFEFAALDYVAPERNRYAYKMEGFDSDWNYIGDRRFATYTNLDPGRYVFRVKGSNSDGVWNEDGTAVQLRIDPPPWRTWWAYSFYALAIGSALFSARRYEMNRIHLKNQVRLEHVEAEKLKELDRVKSRFFANISHEFRTPLTLILGPVRDLIQEKNRTAEGKTKLRLVERNAERLLRLINQLLALSRLEAGKMQLHAAAGDIVAFARGVTTAFSSMADRGGIELAFHTSEEAVELHFDPDKLEDVLINLLSNAFKFTPRGGRIEVSVQKPGDRVELVVKDTGVGIAPEVLPRVFDRFYRAESSATHEHEGSGIGLALVHELVELHHGKIRVDSELGRGTTVLVRLPTGTAHLAPHETLSSPEPAIRRRVPSLRFDTAPTGLVPGGPNRDRTEEEAEIVLLVEDNADLRAYMRERLEGEYELIEAADGVEGLERAKDTIPDVVVSDIMMPRMMGYELCRELKTDERTSHIPVVLLTARAGLDERLEGLETGADDYLTKPFDTRELLARIRNLIRLRRTLRQQFSQAVVLKPSQLGVSSVDEAFLRKALAVVEEYLGDEDFSVEILGRKLGLSRSQLHRKIKALTNQSPTLFIRSIRLQRALELLEKKAGNVAEIAYRVGFSSQAYFTKCFHEQFGCTPTEYTRK